MVVVPFLRQTINATNLHQPFLSKLTAIHSHTTVFQYMPVHSHRKQMPDMHYQPRRMPWPRWMSCCRWQVGSRNQSRHCTSLRCRHWWIVAHQVDQDLSNIFGKTSCQYITIIATILTNYLEYKMLCVWCIIHY